ncbi:hypothetical protein FRX31_011512 [Thalictrum thalictroides]|uniref:Uncharacterized protein n=1 Tax=Thalictrum thalictroides TaxID=46969 RepID=A0A7J6WQK9_THATH|nr:hypothetical protein FRX31_011512 [Thalictrum thalictroides]
MSAGTSSCEIIAKDGCCNLYRKLTKNVDQQWFHLKMEYAPGVVSISPDKCRLKQSNTNR